MVVVGDRDAKFQALGQRMVRLLARGELVVVPGGHGLPLENPGALVKALSVARGMDRGRFVVPENFDDSLPDEMLDAFER